MPARQSSRRARLPRLRELRWITALLLGDDARLAANADRVRDALRAAEPIDEVLYLWEMERVTALAEHRAAELGVEHEAWTQRAAERRRETEVQTALQDLTVGQLIRELAAHDIPAIVLKGAPLAERIHGEPGLRSRSSDVDLLVDPDHLFRAADALVARGWSPPTDPMVRSNGLPQHHLALPGTGPRPSVELHWRVQWYDEGPHSRAMLERAVVAREVPAPSPVDALDVLLQCWARDGLHGLRLAADISAWWRTLGQAHDPEALYAAPNTGRAASVAAQAAAVLMGTPAPSVPVTGRAARLAVAIAQVDDAHDPSVRDLSQRGLVDALVCPPEQRRERIATTFFLEANMSKEAHPWAPRPVVPLLRTASAVRTAIDVAPTVLRARRWRAGSELQA